MSYAERVQALENQGLTTSDAQGVVDAEDMQKVKNETPEPYLVKGHKLPVYDDQAVIDQAIAILDSRIRNTDAISSPAETLKYLKLKLSGLEHEVFSVLLLDNKNHVIDFVELFRGTIDSTAVYPREVIKLILKYNAASVIFSHNHPSGNPEPSKADKSLTIRLKDALALIDVRVLDHVIVGDGEPISFAERGLI